MSLQGLMRLARPSDILLITDAFYMYDTLGFPLEVQMELAQERGALISLLDFYTDALAAGWAPEKALRVIDEACLNVFGKVPRGLL